MPHWVIGIGLGVLATTAFAGHETQEPKGKPLRATYYACVKASRGVTLTLNNCIGDEHQFQDKRLNVAYQKLREGLTTEQRTALRDEEQAWITQRDKACAAAPEGGTANMLDSNQCQLNETAARAIILEDRGK